MLSRGNALATYAKVLTNKLKFGNVLFWVSPTADIVPGGCGKDPFVSHHHLTDLIGDSGAETPPKIIPAPSLFPR
jgi:hypothetical protein